MDNIVCASGKNQHDTHTTQHITAEHTSSISFQSMQEECNGEKTLLNSIKRAFNEMTMLCVCACVRLLELYGWVDGFQMDPHFWQFDDVPW